MENELLKFILYYIAGINLFGFFLMGIDKFKAKRMRWRIPEKNLFLIAIIGGSIGSILGMYVFRHKTRHWIFVIGMPAILIIQIVLVFFMIYVSPVRFLVL